MILGILQIVCVILGSCGVGAAIGMRHARKQFEPVIKSLEDVNESFRSHLSAKRDECLEWSRIAVDRNKVLGEMGQDIEQLKKREAEARMILKPLAEHDPVVRSWLSVEVPRVVSLVSTPGTVMQLGMPGESTT